MSHAQKYDSRMKYVSTEIMMFYASILKHFVCSCHQDFKRLFWHWRQGVLEVYCEMTPLCLLMFCIIWKKKNLRTQVETVPPHEQASLHKPS